MDSSQDRRNPEEPRIALDLPVELEHAAFGDRFEASAVNVSRGGLSMRTPMLPEIGTRLRCELGLSPSPPSMMPALTSSSLNRPIASSSSGGAIRPASLSSVAFTKTTTRIFILLVWAKTGCGLLP